MNQKKLPAIQFYPSDWKNDTKVQSLSFHDRAVWLELLFIMHVAEIRGKLILNGQKMPDIMLAKRIGCSKQTLIKSLANIVKSGVAYVDKNGIIYNKRMVNDQAKRDEEAAFGSLGGNKKKELVKGREGQVLKTPPSASVSNSNSSTTTERVQELRQKSVDSETWLAETHAATEIPTHTIAFFCNEWITGARLKCKLEDYPTNKLIGFMLDDLKKEKEKLMPKPEKVLVPGDSWY